MLKAILRLLVLTILLVPPMALFPATYWLLAPHPDLDAALACVFFGSLSAGLWVLIDSQLSSAPWRLGAADAVRQWKRDRGGLLVNSGEGDVLDVLRHRRLVLRRGRPQVALKYVPYKAFDGEARLRLWLSLFPLACHFPLVPAWLWRRRHA